MEWQFLRDRDEGEISSSNEDNKANKARQRSGR